MEKPRVLVVDDEPEIVGIVAYALETYIFPETRGCEVVTAYNGQQALDKFESTRPDLVVLDLMMPGMDGLEAFRRMRRARSKVPIILLTARDGEADVVYGYELGADLYVTKPFSSRELALQVQAILRRCGLEGETHIITSGPLQINMRTHQATINGRKLQLTSRQFQLLGCLARNAGQVLSWQSLLKNAWGLEDWEGDEKMVKTAIYRLRQNIESEPDNPHYILNVRGAGYTMPPQEETE